MSYILFRFLSGNCNMLNLIHWIESTCLPFGHTEEAEFLPSGQTQQIFCKNVVAHHEGTMLYRQSLLRLNLARCNHSNIYFMHLMVSFLPFFHFELHPDIVWRLSQPISHQGGWLLPPCSCRTTLSHYDVAPRVQDSSGAEMIWVSTLCLPWYNSTGCHHGSLACVKDLTVPWGEWEETAILHCGEAELA